MTERNGHDDRSRSPADSNGDDGDDESGGERTDSAPGAGAEPHSDRDRPTDSSRERELDVESISPEAIPIDALDALEHQYDLEEDESVVDAVLSVVATLQGCEPLDLPPLYEAVDPNNLESIWNANAGTGQSRAVWCTFVLDRTLVTVTSAGVIYAAVLEDRNRE
ncbi:hypothetical protein OB955_02085 [Halobacteria archaeon AArc-m2/3/4]|uniref:Halobacterial output domain-containing protein n=1 Tax=Natronoglomus mannanivorans TaxID=2979990 RepID=A0ABT2Q9E4_9EURY|nr:hypothetical protein [Halobacteria archaeon AArc-m2/3/4]